LKAAGAPPPIKMAHKIALAILEESTISHSHPCPSMLLNAIVPLLSMELSRELATAASLMLSTCKQDRFALLAAMHQAACVIDPSMVLSLIVCNSRFFFNTVTANIPVNPANCACF